MSTSFNLIYENFLELIKGTSLASLKKEDLMGIMYIYLDKAKSLEFKQCRKNLKSFIPPTSFIQEYVGDGITKDFAINIPPMANSINITRVDGADVNSTFNGAVNIYSMAIPPILNSKVEVGWSFAGSFNDNLDSEEIWILACAMLLSWLDPLINDENLLRDSIGDRDFKESSHANLLNQLYKLKADTRDKLKAYVNNYTFNDFEGLN